tara:strand:- start:1105 stop:1308 length:204 start_codon:yes stop_codon:yes gene_type:complete
MTPATMDIYARAIANDCPDPSNAQRIGELFVTLRPDINKEYFIQLINKHWSEIYEQPMLEHYGVSYG